MLQRNMLQRNMLHINEIQLLSNKKQNRLVAIIPNKVHYTNVANFEKIGVQYPQGTRLI